MITMMFSPWKGNDTLRYSLFLFSCPSFSFYYEVFISNNVCSTYVFQRGCLCLSPLLKYLKLLSVSCKANTYSILCFHFLVCMLCVSIYVHIYISCICTCVHIFLYNILLCLFFSFVEMV